MKSVKVPVPSHRILAVGWWVAGFAVLGLIGYLLVTVIQLSDRSDLSQADRADIRSEVSLLESDLASQEATSNALAEQIESLGQVPIVEPTPPPSSNTTVSPSFSFIQRLIDIGVAARCGGGSCLGQPGPPGAAGANGTDGTNGTTPSDERLISLITPLIPAPVPGAPGANGVNGADGRGIVSLSCSSLVSFEYTVTYTDGSTQTVSCGPAPEPPVVVDPPLEPAA